MILLPDSKQKCTIFKRRALCISLGCILITTNYLCYNTHAEISRFYLPYDNKTSAGKLFTLLWNSFVLVAFQYTVNSFI